MHTKILTTSPTTGSCIGDASDLALASLAKQDVQPLLDMIEKDHPSILRTLAEETIIRLYAYEHGSYTFSWLLGIEADLANALNHWGSGCLNTLAKRQALKTRVKTVLTAYQQQRITINSTSLERIQELTVTINVVNETMQYLYEMKGRDCLHSVIQQVYDLKRLIEWKRRTLENRAIKTDTKIMTEVERLARTPLQIMHTLKQRMITINSRLLTKQGRDEIIEEYSELCESVGFTRYCLLHHALAETADMLNQLFQFCYRVQGVAEEPA